MTGDVEMLKIPGVEEMSQFLFYLASRSRWVCFDGDMTVLYMNLSGYYIPSDQ